MKPIGSNRSFPILSALIIFISTALLAVWSLKNTIALRNTLLATGTLLALLLLWQYSRGKGSKSNSSSSSSSWAQYTPLILSFAMLIWVVIHYLLFSNESGQQFQELSSTWLRVLESIFIGLATGLVLREHPRRAQFLWLGIFGSFIYLLIHYLGMYFQTGQAFMPNYYFSSPFGNKINTVLMGGLFISAICGSAATALIHNRPSYPWPIYCYWLLGVLTILFAFTTIIDTRNGVGVGIILIVSWLLFVGASKLKQQMELRKLDWKIWLVPLIPTVLIIIFIQQHLSINRGWNHFVDDVTVAIKIDEVPNWQDVQKYGYPNTASGEQVYPNNYERAAWAAAGVHSITQNPLGYGLLEHSLSKVIRKSYPEATIRSSHSAWIDLGLAFGIPGLFLTLGALLSTVVLALRSNSPNRLVVIWITADLLLTFTIAEVSSKHTIEILFFCIALLNTMLLGQKNFQSNTALN
ncbi:O-antigen ligase family protein [Polynucleobacter sp. 15G-AUS-farblos]|uniref:O-antigen ligase family protein n=1 Tax=Polynucleobacter sp. 15G-AUS-farblos TaxID=2689094 RepID=UPI001C0C9A3E|nr:O-antigen ligase family protein [Polynucleobacter sp. 15G-AUS-farblos]MBU3583791.1 O-antigen ligase family protein [Polynucleobacter sp. 15G-AUS-farblos]